MMWRNSLNLSSRFFLNSSGYHSHLNSTALPNSDGLGRLLLLLHTRFLHYSSSTTSADPLRNDAVRAFSGSSSSAAAIDLSSPVPLNVFKAKDVLDLMRHYGRCYWELSKARLSILVVATSGTGFVLGSGNAIDFAGLCCTCAGIMMVAASANSLNQVFEITNDAKMKRTRQRPLPSGRISKPHAVTWASCVGLAGTSLLATQANILAAGLAASNLILYAFVYTPLKQIHPVNTWVGAVVGAIPPLLGWAAALGSISLNAMILPATLYFWQIPHFMALAYMCRKDYADGGFKMYSLADASGQRTSVVAVRNSLYLLPLGFLAYDWDLASGWFCLESSILTLAITAAAFSFYTNRRKEEARKMFYASLLYLPVFMSGLLIHRHINDNQLLQTAGFPHRPFGSSSEMDLLEDKTNNVEQKAKTEGSAVGVKARPPVAYASAAPFPFLPAPSYTAP